MLLIGCRGADRRARGEVASESCPREPNRTADIMDVRPRTILDDDWQQVARSVDQPGPILQEGEVFEEVEVCL